MSPSITRTLTFILCISLPYYMIYKGNEKQKKEETDTKLHKWDKLPLKTLLKLFSPLFWKIWGIYRQREAPGRHYGATCRSSTSGTTIRSRKHDFCCVSAALLGSARHARVCSRRLHTTSCTSFVFVWICSQIWQIGFQKSMAKFRL